MKVGKQAEKKELTKKQRVNRDRFKKAVICFIVSVCLFVALLVFQTSVLKQESKTKVYKATSNILEDTEITENNFSNFFYESYVLTNEIESGTITNPSQAYGMFLERDMVTNEVLTSNKIGENLTSILENMEKPIKISFQASSVVDAVAGEIRKGDLVNIYCVYTEEDAAYGTTDYIVEEVGRNVYIQGSYDAGANEVENMISEKTESGVENKENNTSTTVFTICIPEEYEQSFIMSSLKGQFLVTKVLYPGDKVIFGTNVTYKETLKTGSKIETGEQASTNGVNEAGTKVVNLDLASLELVNGGTTQYTANTAPTEMIVKDKYGYETSIVIEDGLPKELSELLSEEEIAEFNAINSVDYMESELFNKVKEKFIQYSVELTTSVSVDAEPEVEETEETDESADVNTEDETTGEEVDNSKLDKTSEKFRFVQYQLGESGDMIAALTDSDKGEDGSYERVVIIDFSNEQYKAGVAGYDELKANGFEDAAAVQEYLMEVIQAYKNDSSLEFVVE